MREYLIQASGVIVGIVIGVLATAAVGPSVIAPEDPRGILGLLDGRALDRAYAEYAIARHEESIELSQEVLARSDDEEVRYMAAEIISVQSDQVGIMREWLARWYSEE